MAKAALVCAATSCEVVGALLKSAREAAVRIVMLVNEWLGCDGSDGGGGGYLRQVGKLCPLFIYTYEETNKQGRNIITLFVEVTDNVFPCFTYLGAPN